MAHPNTFAAGLSTGFATFVVYMLNKYAGTHLNQVDGAAIAGGAASVVLWVGRRGIKGAFASLWNGSPKQAPAE